MFTIKDHYTIRMFNSIIISKLFYKYNVISLFNNYSKSRYVYGIFYCYFYIYIFKFYHLYVCTFMAIGKTSLMPLSIN